MLIVATALTSVTSKSTNIHWNILHTVKVENGEVKAFFFDDASFQKLGFKQDFLTNLQTGKIVHLKAQYDDRGNIVEVEEA
jgi:hypothetical protein